MTWATVISGVMDRLELRPQTLTGWQLKVSVSPMPTRAVRIANQLAESTAVLKLPAQRFNLTLCFTQFHWLKFG